MAWSYHVVLTRLLLSFAVSLPLTSSYVYCVALFRLSVTVPALGGLSHCLGRYVTDSAAVPLWSLTEASRPAASPVVWYV